MVVGNYHMEKDMMHCDGIICKREETLFRLLGR